MPYSRQRPPIPPTGRVAVRLTTGQRDLFLRSHSLPRELGHPLHHAVVRRGKLQVRVTRSELDALIAAAAQACEADAAGERALTALLGYLESIEDRFAEPDEGDDENAE